MKHTLKQFSYALNKSYTTLLCFRTVLWCIFSSLKLPYQRVNCVVLAQVILLLSWKAEAAAEQGRRCPEKESSLQSCRRGGMWVGLERQRGVWGQVSCHLFFWSGRCFSAPPGGCEMSCPLEMPLSFRQHTEGLWMARLDQIPQF